MFTTDLQKGEQKTNDVKLIQYESHYVPALVEILFSAQTLSLTLAVKRIERILGCFHMLEKRFVDWPEAFLLLAVFTLLFTVYSTLT